MDNEEFDVFSELLGFFENDASYSEQDIKMEKTYDAVNVASDFTEGFYGEEFNLVYEEAQELKSKNKALKSKKKINVSNATIAI